MAYIPDLPAPQSPPPASDPFARLWRALLRIFGILFLLAGLGLLAREVLFGQLAVSALGTVIEIKETDSGDGPNYIPIVEFKTKNNGIITFEGTSTNPPRARGSSVPVLYNPNAAQEARIDTFADRWMFPTVFIPIGLVLLIGGLVAGESKPLVN
jgi:hypothetical protein